MKKMICVLLSLAVLFGVAGCWDSNELDTLFIVTGVGLDTGGNTSGSTGGNTSGTGGNTSGDPGANTSGNTGSNTGGDTSGSTGGNAAGQVGEVDVSVQIAKIAGGSSNSGTSTSSGSSGSSGESGGGSILLEASGKSVLAAISSMRHQSTRTLYLHHNQMIVFGKDLAQKGIKEHLDLFLRFEESRMETLVLVADGKAKDILSAELDQDKLSGVAVARMMKQYATISTYLNVNMLTLTSKLLQKTTAPLIPIVEVQEKNQKKNLVISRMAVFKRDRMVGELNWDEITGYLWTMGQINEGILEIATDKGTVSMNIIAASNTLTPVIQSDGRMGVLLNIDTVLDFEELNGFGDVKLEELHGMLTQEAIKTIEKRVYTTFDKTKQLNADIYEFGGKFRIKYPKQWKTIEQQWDTLYPSLQLVLKVKAHIVGTGKTGLSLDMEENKK
jgi:spore germination protein KC